MSVCTPPQHSCVYRCTGVLHTGLVVVVVDGTNVSVFRVEDGSFARRVATGQRWSYDVEECEGGLLLACVSMNTIEFVAGGGAGWASLGGTGSRDGQFMGPSALALVPGLGLVVRETDNNGRVQFFATPDAIAMASMSTARVAWLACVARVVLLRRGVLAPSAGAPLEGVGKKPRTTPPT